jgi:translation initiation factor IF-1
VRRIEGCRDNRACVARISAQVRRLRTPGRVRIVRVDDVATLAVGSHTDKARIVWKAGARLPTVQCVQVRRTGNPLAGYDIHILSLSPPIAREASCPG